MSRTRSMAVRYLPCLRNAVLTKAHRRRYSSMNALPSFTSQIEVERKFQPTPQLRWRLGLDTKAQESNRDFQQSEVQECSEEVLRVFRFPDSVIRDVYYDLNDDQLANKGVWIRHRSSSMLSRYDAAEALADISSAKLEAKVRLGGDFADSQFHEIEGESSIRSYLDQYFSGTKMENLAITADLETHRKSWSVYESDIRGCRDGDANTNDPQILIVLDDVLESDQGQRANEPFVHQVGEVEMTKEVIGGADEQEHQQMKRKEAKHMDVLIEAFMVRHKSLFLRLPKPMGKLSAYFEWKANGLGANADP